MMGLRILSLLAGALVLFVPPMMLFDTGVGGMPPWLVAGGILGMIVISASFLYVGVAGRRMRRPGQARTLGGVLLTVPMVAAVVTLATHTDESTLLASGALLGVTILLFASFVFPATMDRRRRPMRERDPLRATHHAHDAVVLQLHRR